LRHRCICARRGSTRWLQWRPSKRAGSGYSERGLRDMWRQVRSRYSCGDQVCSRLAATAVAGASAAGAGAKAQNRGPENRAQHQTEGDRMMSGTCSTLKKRVNPFFQGHGGLLALPANPGEPGGRHGTLHVARAMAGAKVGEKIHSPCGSE
jgi:hypothetical protein